MLILQFFHAENKLIVNGKSYRATCYVRNEINGKRKKSQVVKTYPLSNHNRTPYYPRPFPTGTWEIKKPIFTDNIEYAPVKIPTDAFQRVLTWTVDKFGYKELSGDHQTDSFYHLHYSKNSKTTLGCIRLDSYADAIEISKEIIEHQDKNIQCFIEVFANEGKYE